jgi:hypothetical protein
VVWAFASQAKGTGSIPVRGTRCGCNPIGRGPGLNPVKCRFESCHPHHIQDAYKCYTQRMKYERRGLEIVALLNAGRSNSEIASLLGVSPSSVTHHAKKLGLSNGRYSRSNWPEIINYYNSGASYEKCCKRFGITLGTMWKAARRGVIKPRPRARPPMTAKEHAEKFHGKRGGRDAIRMKILAENIIPYRCAICNINVWRDQPITLNLDHIDGDGTNNRLSNFRFLCPNCDSQQPTYGYKNRGRYRESGEMGNTLVLETSAEKA